MSDSVSEDCIRDTTRESTQLEDSPGRWRGSEIVFTHFLPRRRDEQLVERVAAKCGACEVARGNWSLDDQFAVRIESPYHTSTPDGIPQTSVAIDDRPVRKPGPLRIPCEFPYVRDGGGLGVVLALPDYTGRRI